MRFWLLLALGTAATAGTITVTGTAEPWDPTLPENSAYNFSYGGSTPPVIAATGLTGGNEVIIAYVDGLDYTNIDFCCVDGNGYNGLGVNSAYAAYETDSSAPNGAPGDDLPSADDPIYLQEVLGTFTDSSGDIIGTPFVVGDGTTVIVPVGATQLQLGINDNYFPDNGDNPDGPPLTYNITSNGTVSSVPEPGTLALVGGAAVIGLFVRRRKRVSA
jgi:hypothetical protein